jgi:hypothetical protein
MTTNEKDIRNQQADSRSKEQTKDGNPKRETRPNNLTGNPTRQPGQQTNQRRQNKAGTQQRTGSTSSQARTNPNVQERLEREEDTTDELLSRKSRNNIRSESRNTERR